MRIGTVVVRELIKPAVRPNAIPKAWGGTIIGSPEGATGWPKK